MLIKYLLRNSKDDCPEKGIRTTETQRTLRGILKSNEPAIYHFEAKDGDL
jgi:hypothetical protein